MLSQEDRDRIEERVLEIAATIAGKRAQEFVEIAEAPRWHALIVRPNQERRAVKFLSLRGFGVFDPFIKREREVRGRKRFYLERLLPGYVFAFLWNLERNYTRVLACPHVIGFAKTTHGNPVTISDKEVEKLEGQEISESAVFAEVARMNRPPATTRKQKRYRKEALNAEPVEIPRVRSYSALWDGIEDLDSEERICRFRRALCLGS